MKNLILTLLICSFVHSLSTAQDFNITAYGAIKNDTSKLSTKAIKKAINACFSAGGGRVVIPPGNYKSGTITLKNNVELFLSAGAVLLGSKDHIDFPQQRQPVYRSQKDPGGWYALIYAEGASNIAITGRGTIDGQGAFQKPQPRLLGSDRDGRPRNILLISCSKVLIDGITLTNSGIWNEHYLDCEDVTVNNIHVFNHSNKNNDGIDIDDCRMFKLSNSVIDSDDDGIVLKSTGNKGCKDITITNCIVSSYTNAIKCGTESTGGFKNIAISNCVIKPTRSIIPSMFGLPALGITGISLEIVDGGIMDGVTISNIVIEGTQCPIYVRLGNRARKYLETAPEPPLGQMRNISISHITAYDTGTFSSSITGIPGAKIENISLDHINIISKGGVNAGDYLADPLKVKEDEKGYPEPLVWRNLPSYGFYIRHVKNITMSQISLGSKAPEIRVPVIAVDVEKLAIDHLDLASPGNQPALLLQDVKTYQVDFKAVKKID